ncbi:MAG TPA: COX15/CtaA family protein [Polyangiaceae bacterium]|nr:COX15/CtaA family protein [Polyangiaceae bacterium]
MSAPIPAVRPQSAARRFAGFTLAYTVFVILFGAVVRITGSGAGCGQHWPTCHGDIVHLPRTVETAIELTHRVTSGLALVAVFALLALVLREKPRGHPARRLALGAAALMILEALIGAGLVLLALVGANGSVARAVVMPTHLLSTYALTAVLALLVVWRDAPSERASRPSPLLVAGGLALVVVSATGAVTALGDTLYPPEAASMGARLAEDQASGAHFLARLRVVHPVLAVLAAAFVGYAALRTGGRMARPVVVLCVLQVTGGALNVILSAPGWLQVIHLGLALSLWLAFVLLAYDDASSRGEPP